MLDRAPATRAPLARWFQPRWVRPGWHDGSVSGFRPPISVFLAHPDASVRQSLADEIAGTGIAMVGETDNGADALARILDLVPDVALIGVDLPDVAGPDLCRALRAELPICRVLLVLDAGAADDDATFDGLVAGAYGCHLIDDPVVPLVKGIRGTMRRESLPTPGWAARILEQYAEIADHEADRMVPAPKLTPTETEVMNRLAAGATPEEIAELHQVTTHMVRLHAGYAIIKLYRGMADEQLMTAIT